MQAIWSKKMCFAWGNDYFLTFDGCENMSSV